MTLFEWLYISLAVIALVFQGIALLAKIQGGGKRKKRYTKVAQKQAFESEQAVLKNELNEEVTSVLVISHDEGDAR